MRLFAIVSSFTALFMLAACGTGGGSTGQSDGSSSSSPSASATIGERLVPGYSVSASHVSAIQPGQPCAIRVTVTPEAGQPALVKLEAWLGTSVYDASLPTSVATPVPGEADTYDVALDLPAHPPTDTVVWIRFTTVDGAVLEAGRDAFKLATE